MEQQLARGLSLVAAALYLTNYRYTKKALYQLANEMYHEYVYFGPATGPVIDTIKLGDDKYGVKEEGSWGEGAPPFRTEDSKDQA